MSRNHHQSEYLFDERYQIDRWILHHWVSAREEHGALTAYLNRLQERSILNCRAEGAFRKIGHRTVVRFKAVTRYIYISNLPIKSPRVFRQLFGAAGSRVRISGQKILSAPLLNFQKNIGFVCVGPNLTSQIGGSK